MIKRATSGLALPGLLASSGISLTTMSSHAAETFSNAGDVDEIVVTTRKREENLQEVPIAINVLGAEQIAREGIRGLDEISKLSPSIQFERGFSENGVRVTIRGLSNTRGRANAAFLVDGIDVTSEVTGNNSGSPQLINQRLLNDVERIEIVKGSQSALYGRAAFAGAINYVTKEPADEFEADYALDIAEYGQQEIFTGASIPLSDTMGIRLTGVLWNEDGVYDNVISGNKFGGGDGYGLAGTFVWEPVDAVKIKSRLSYTDEKYAPSAVADNSEGKEITIPVPQDAIDAGVTSETEVTVIPFIGNADGLVVRASEDPLTGGDYPGNTLEVLRGSIIATWDIDDYTLSSNTGYTDADFTQRYDYDRQALGRPDELLGNGEYDTFGNTRQISQELRIATNWDDSPINLTAGLQYWNEERDDFSRSISVSCRDSSVCGPDQGGGFGISPFESWQDLYDAAIENAGDYRNPIFADTEHWSAYLMAEWNISDRWSLTLENRFVKEEFDAMLEIGANCSNPFPSNANLDGYFLDPENNGPTCEHGNPQSPSTDSEYQTPKLTLEYQASENALLYASIAKAMKPAGVSLILVPVKLSFPTESFVFEEEKMWSYEIGAKTEWQGAFGNIVFNSAAFFLNYEDKQTNTQTLLGGCIPSEFGDLPAECLDDDPGNDPQAQAVGKPTNASGAWVKGLELDASWQTPIEGLTLSAAMTRLSSEYDDFTDPTRSAGRIAVAGTCGEAGPSPADKDPFTPGDQPGATHCFLDLSGNELEYLPKRSYVVAAKFEKPLAATGLDWFVESNASYMGKRYTGAGNFTQLDKFWKADVRLGLSGDRWDLVGYVNNVFDDNTITSASGNPDVAVGYIDNFDSPAPPTLPTAYLPDPRIYGLRFRYQY